MVEKAFQFYRSGVFYVSLGHPCVSRTDLFRGRVSDHRMGEWMMLPEAEYVIAARITRFRSAQNRQRWTWKFTGPDHLSSLVSNIDFNDIANLADVGDVPLWECEIPLSDDGF